MIIDGEIGTIRKNRRIQFEDNAENILNLCTITNLSSTIKLSVVQGMYLEWKQDYHSMLTQGKKIDKLTMDEFRVFVMAVYGWMPVLYSQRNIVSLKKNYHLNIKSRYLRSKILL